MKTFGSIIAFVGVCVAMATFFAIIVTGHTLQADPMPVLGCAACFILFGIATRL